MSHKIPYLVEFNPITLEDGSTFFEKRILDTEYPHELTGEDHKVIKIEEEFEFGKKFVTIFYDDGEEESSYGIYRVFRKLNVK
jgi:hypothetical protein